MDSVLKEISCPVYCPINLQNVKTVTLNSQLFSAACPRISKEKTPPEGRDVCEQLRRILNPGPLLCVRQCWTPLPIQEAFQWRTCWLENRTAEKIKGKYTGTPASNYVLATAIGCRSFRIQVDSHTSRSFRRHDLGRFAYIEVVSPTIRIADIKADSQTQFELIRMQKSQKTNFSYSLQRVDLSLKDASLFFFPLFAWF